MSFREILRLYKKHSVSLSGEKGSGKDLLTANVIARSNYDCYISNIDYELRNKTFIPIDFKKLDLGGNSYRNFINGNIRHYNYPYPDKADIFISDCGIYFPSQYCNELNKEFRYMPTFMALSRHLSGGYAGVHTNCQNLNRVWDKIREQSTVYINCRSCFVVGPFVVQFIRIYERYDSACNQIQPFRANLPLFANKEKRDLATQEKIRYINQHGFIKPRILFYINKSNYDTHFFKKLLFQGDKIE